MTIDLSPEGRKRLRELRDKSPGTWRWALCYQRHDGTHWGIKSDVDPVRVVGLGLVSIATEDYNLEEYPTAAMNLAVDAVNALIPLLDALEAAIARANAAEASREAYAQDVAETAFDAGLYFRSFDDDDFARLRKEAITRALAECTPEPLPEKREPEKEGGTADAESL